jgi:hypothetical protein
MRYSFILALTLAACFGIQSLALRAVGGKTNKSESNFFSSLARIQSGIRDHPEIMLLGSSMTGRLPDRNQGFPGVANLGCDGSSAVDTLRAMDEGKLPMAPVLIIEGNTLYRAVSGTRTEIARAIDSPWFKVGSQVRNLSATARPAAFAYSNLMARKLGTANQDLQILKTKSSPEILNGPAPALDEAEARLIHDLAAVIGRLQKRGSRFLITVIPPGGTSDSAYVRLPMALALEARVPYWNIHSELPQDFISYTDGLHMSPRSAAAIMKLLSEATKL